MSTHTPLRAAALALALGVAATPGSRLAAQASPPVSADSADGPIPMGTTKGERVGRLVIRNATMLTGRGTPGTNRAMPPEGPVDIVIEGNTIVDIVPMDPVNAAGYGRQFRRPTGDRVIDATGMYVMPGLVEMHAHLPADNREMGARALDYAYRLYLGHGVTTVRDAGTGAGLQTMVEQRRLAAANQLVAPRLVLCQRWPLPLRKWNEGDTPEKARVMVRQFKALGADCVKVSKSPGHYPDVLRAIADEAKRLGSWVMVDLKVSETDARVASEAGVRSIEHWYGIPDAAVPDGRQHFPATYNYSDESDRFRWAGRLWREADPTLLARVLDTLVAAHVAWVPTLDIYEASRDLQRAQTQPWFADYLHPTLEEYFRPDPANHGSYFIGWSSTDETYWKQNYALWMAALRDFERRGGTIGVGDDAGFIYQMYGFGLIRELELQQEAGFDPLRVIQHATGNNARILGRESDLGRVRVGWLGDLIVVNGNPLENLKVLYPTGSDEVRNGRAVHSGGVEWTIKEGIPYHVPRLMAEVKAMVAEARAARKR
jgi:imidazolonepropionase-like amidohydrolase